MRVPGMGWIINDVPVRQFAERALSDLENRRAEYLRFGRPATLDREFEEPHDTVLVRLRALDRAVFNVRAVVLSLTE